LIREVIDKDYIVLTQKPDYKNDPAWIFRKALRGHLSQNNGLPFSTMLPTKAVEAIQKA